MDIGNVVPIDLTLAFIFLGFQHSEYHWLLNFFTKQWLPWSGLPAAHTVPTHCKKIKEVS